MLTHLSIYVYLLTYYTIIQTSVYILTYPDDIPIMTHVQSGAPCVLLSQSNIEKNIQ